MCVAEAREPALISSVGRHDPVSSVFVGVDIGKRKHQSALLGEKGEVLAKTLSFPNSLIGFESFLKQMAPWTKEDILIGLEATGHYWIDLYTHLTDSGYSVVVINPLQTDGVRNMYMRKTKNDRADALIIADVLRFGRFRESSVPEENIAQLQSLSRMRTGMVLSIGSLKRSVITVLDRLFPEFESCFKDVFSKSSMTVLDEYADPEDLSNCPLEKLTNVLWNGSNGRLGVVKAELLKKTASRSFGTAYAKDAMKFQLKLLLDQARFIQSQVDEIEKKIKELMKEHQLITTIPGISDILGAAILGEIGEVSRFESPKQVVAFAGLDPSVHQSGSFNATSMRISKRGSPHLRRALYIAAHVARIHDPVLKEYYEKLMGKGKHHRQAQTAVAAKLARIVYSVLFLNEPYDQEKLKLKPKLDHLTA